MICNSIIAHVDIKQLKVISGDYMSITRNQVKTNELNAPLMSREDAARYLGVQPKTLAMWACTGRYSLTMVKVGRLAKYRKSDLDNFISNNTLSAGVHKVGELPKSGCGFHLYIPINNATDIPRISDILFKMLWLAGYGHFDISKSGALLTRTIIDSAIYSLERLDFVGKPHVVGENLAWTRPSYFYRGGNYLCSERLADLTQNDLTAYSQMVASSKNAAAPESEAIAVKWKSTQVNKLVDLNIPLDEAEKQTNSHEVAGKTVLGLNFVLHFDKVGKASVRDVMADPKRFDMDN